MNNRIKDVIAKIFRPPKQGRQAIALSRADADRITLVPGVALISITAPELSPALLPEYEHLLRLSFADVDFLGEELSPKAKRKVATAITRAQVREILSFVNALPSSVHTLLVHCEGGFSRSCGVVSALHTLYGYEIEEDRLAQANKSVTKIIIKATFA